MATVQLTDIYNPVTFSRHTQEAQLKLNRFVTSGVAVQDAQLSTQLSGGGNIGEFAGFAALTATEPNYSSDNSATNSTPGNITSQKMIFRTASRNASWSAMDLAREVALQDPVGAITNRIGAFWASDDEARLIASLQGILADNIANDAGDMLVSVATDASSAVTDAERINGDRVIAALQTLGDHKENISTMAIHSAVHARLQRQNLIQYERAAGSDIMFPTYLGKKLIVDDSLPAVAGTNRITYTCILFGAGAVATGSGPVLVPSEIDRKPSAGNGGGETIIHSRVSNVWHPYGFSFLSASVAGKAATYAELKTAANWNRVHNRKNIPLAFLNVND